MLHAATYLGNNTIAPLAEIAAQLNEQTNHSVHFDQSQGYPSDHAAAHVLELDLVWMCGGLFADMNALDQLNHDTLVAPVFAGETEAVYRSVIIARTDGPSSLREALGQTVAINEDASWSGHRALRRHLGDAWFANEMISGSHRESIEAVASGHADCAAIDSSIWNATQPSDSPSPLVVVDQTDDWPAPPILLRRGLAENVRSDLERVLQGIEDLSGVRSLQPASASAYDIMRTDEQ